MMEGRDDATVAPTAIRLPIFQTAIFDFDN